MPLGFARAVGIKLHGSDDNLYETKNNDLKILFYWLIWMYYYKIKRRRCNSGENL